MIGRRGSAGPGQQAVSLDPAEFQSQHKQPEQDQRQPDPPAQAVNDTQASAFVADQEIETRAQRIKYGEQKQDNDDFARHDAHNDSGKMTVYRPRLALAPSGIVRRTVPWTAAVLGIAFFIVLGLWQLDRAAEKRALLAAAGAAPELTWPPPDGEALRFARLTVTGRFDPERHLLLDNQILGGRYGAHVLTPFLVTGGGTVMVDRGWVPLAAERRLPEIETPPGEVTIEGRINHWPAAGIRLGRPDRLAPDRWPQLVVYPDSTAVAGALRTTLPDWLLQLDASAPGGFAGRDAWPLVNFGPERHLAYAMTWFTLALTVLLVSGALGWRHLRSAPEGAPGR